jgi:hypothetical protein
LVSRPFLVEETNDLASDVLAAGLLVVHDTGRGGEDDVAELTGREQLDNPLLELGETDVVAGRDDTGLVETAVELDNDLAGSVVIDLLELANVAVALHNLEELGDDLGRRSDQDLALASLLGVVDGVERIVEDGSADHFGGVLDKILKSGREMRYLTRSMLAFQRLPERGECPQQSIARVLPPNAEEEKRIEGVIASP